MSALQSIASESLRERKKRQTRRRIRDVAASLFIEQGFASSTIDAIAQRAEISKPTFFNYYESKLAVLQELIEITDNQFVQYIRDAIKQNGSTAERLHGLMSRSAEYIHARPEFTRLTLMEGLSAFADRDLARVRFQRLHQAMGDLVKAGICQREVRGDYPIDLLVQMLVGGYLYALLNWFASSEGDLAQIMADTARFLADAIAPPAVTI